jgi:hypothetical protein
VEAGEIIAAVQVAMLAGLPYTSLRDAIAIFTHPTMLKGLIPLLSAHFERNHMPATYETMH